MCTRRPISNGVVFERCACGGRRVEKNLATLKKEAACSRMRRFKGGCDMNEPSRSPRRDRFGTMAVQPLKRETPTNPAIARQRDFVAHHLVRRRSVAPSFKLIFSVSFSPKHPFNRGLDAFFAISRLQMDCVARNTAFVHCTSAAVSRLICVWSG